MKTVDKTSKGLKGRNKVAQGKSAPADAALTYAAPNTLSPDGATQDGNLPDGWKWITLGEALPIRYGKARTFKAGHERPNSPVYGSSGVIDSFDRALTKGPALVIGRKGSVGALHYSPVPCWPIDTVYFVEASPDRNLLYFKYLLEYTQLGKMDRSTAVPGLSRDDYNAKEIPLAPLPVQHLIVAEIEKQFTRLDAGVAALKRVKANLKRYRASVLKAACEGRLVPTEAELARAEGRTYETADVRLQRILKERREKWNGKVKYREPAIPNTRGLPKPPQGWCWATAEQLSDGNRPITYGVIKLGEHVPDGIPILRSSDVRHLHLDLQDVKRISPAIATNFRRTFLEGGEILVTVRGTLGGVAVAPEACSGFNISREVAMIALVESSLESILAFFIGSIPVQNWLLQRTRGIAYTGINIATLKELPIPLPPLAEQERIVAELEQRLDVVDTLAFVLENNLQRAGRLRQSILKVAFEGRIELHNWS